MKQMVLLIGFLLGSTVLSAHSGDRLSEGRWYEVHGRKVIKIDHSKKGIKVKGLGRKKARFKFVSRNQLFDNVNRELRILNRDRILITMASGHQRMFVDAPWKAELAARDFPRHKIQRNNDRPIRLEGSWRFFNGRTAHIVEDRNGLKVKIRSHGGWVYYSMTSRHGLFADSKGNSIEILSGNSLIWKSFDGAQRIELKKWSDELI